MISLSCTSCKKVLEIDDAFAGGVCRCQFCGTIQTVPSALKKVIRPGSPGVAAKTLYQRTTGNTASSSSSVAGAAAKSAFSTPARAAAPPVTVTVTPAARRPRILIAIAIVALVVIISAAIALTHLHF